MNTTIGNTTVESMLVTFNIEVSELNTHLKYLKERRLKIKDDQFDETKRELEYYTQSYVLNILENLANLKPHLVKELGETEVENLYTTADLYEIANYVSISDYGYDWTPSSSNFRVVLEIEDEEDDW